MSFDLDDALLMWLACCFRCQHMALVCLLRRTGNSHLLELFDIERIVEEWLLDDITARLAPEQIAVVTFWGDELQFLEADGKLKGRLGLAAEFTEVLASICRRALSLDMLVWNCASSHLLTSCQECTDTSVQLH